MDLKCSRRDCENTAMRRNSSTTYYCERCYRVLRMAGAANHRYPAAKLTFEVASELLAATEPLRICPHCGQSMTLHASIAGKASVVSIQHYRDGRLGVICHRCNSRHGQSQLGDRLFTDVQANQKYCPHCKEIKLRSDFGPSVRSGVADYCRNCAKFLRKQSHARIRGARSLFYQAGADHRT